MKYQSPLQMGKVLSKLLLVVKLMSKNYKMKKIAVIIKTTVATQKPNRKGDPIGFIEVIYAKFLNCLTALDAEMLFFCE